MKLEQQEVRFGNYIWRYTIYGLERSATIICF